MLAELIASLKAQTHRLKLTEGYYQSIGQGRAVLNISFGVALLANSWLNFAKMRFAMAWVGDALDSLTKLTPHQSQGIGKLFPSA